jgi:hypothetical protein
MSSEFQTIAALVIVALAATWLTTRALGKRSKPGCGVECKCPSRELKR